jgi:hypothetical protein
MITGIKIKNFKALQDTGWISVDGNVVFVGPNNSGKTTALQALALWSYGIRKWIERRQSSKAQVRTGAPINRKDLFAIPVTSNKHIWTNLFPMISDRDADGKMTGTRHNCIEVTVKGLDNGHEWICGLEFRYNNEEVIYVKPIQELPDNIAVANCEALKDVTVAFLPPMSGLKLEEEKLLFSTVEYRMGEGRTAEVLGNLCYQVIYPENEMLGKDRDPIEDWQLLTSKLKKLFLVDLKEPTLDNKGIIRLKYVDANRNELDIASSGRGMQQILLLLAYILIKPKCIILLDEPDAHLEILRQEQVYELLTEVAKRKGSQLLIASHSEVVLRKAVASDDKVIAFYPLVQPQLISDKGSELLKSLRTIGFDEYFLAHQNKWVFYLEGPTDLAILKRFAGKLNHPVVSFLEVCFCKTINCNDPMEARKHFSGLKDAEKSVAGVAIYDNILNPLNTMQGLHERMWTKNEIENYFFSQCIFLSWAEGKTASSQDLFSSSEVKAKQEAMTKALDDILPGAAKRDEHNEYWSTSKASNEIEKILKAYYTHLGQKGDSSKKNYINFIDYLPNDKVDPEVVQMLDFIFNLVKKL